MKSIKKRFKSLLADVEGRASELRLLSSRLELLGDVRELADRVLYLCEILNRRAAALSKIDFAEQMRVDENLLELDEMIDADLISTVEQRFSVAIPADQSGTELENFLGQLLDKLEACHTAMVENIQRMTALLVDPG